MIALRLPAAPAPQPLPDEKVGGKPGGGAGAGVVVAPKPDAELSTALKWVNAFLPLESDKELLARVFPANGVTTVTEVLALDKARLQSMNIMIGQNKVRYSISLSCSMTRLVVFQACAIAFWRQSLQRRVIGCRHPLYPPSRLHPACAPALVNGCAQTYRQRM